MEEVKSWLSDAGHPYVQSENNDAEPNDNQNYAEPSDNQSVVSDEINPEDSPSNISSLRRIILEHFLS